LRARVDWLSSYLDGLPEHVGRIEQLETGADLARVQKHGETTRGLIPSGERPPTYEAARANTDRHCDRHGFETLDGQSQAGPHIPDSRSSYTSGWEVLPSNHSLRQDAAARRFVDAYFRNVHRAYPFIDRNKIMHGLEAVGDMSRWPRNVDSALLYLVMAVGCTSLQRAGQVPEDTSARFEIVYADIIQECLHKEGLASVQMLLLLALYSLFDPVGPSAWSIVGIASRQAVSIGLALKISSVRDRDPLQAEQRHRLFWSLYVFERMMATSLGLPVDQVSKNTHVPLPALTVEEFASVDRPNFAQTLRTSRQVIQLRQIEEQIMQQVHLGNTCNPRANSDAAALEDIRTTVEDWYSSGCLASGPEEDNVPVHNSVTWLSARYYYLLLLLYCPKGFSLAGQLVPSSELLGYAQRHIQSQFALWQQRQLPLNRVTLYRFLPVGTILMSCLSSGGSTVLAALEDVAVLIRMLESFSERWRVAVEAAAIIQEFAVALRSRMSSSPAATLNSCSNGDDRLFCQTAPPHLTRLLCLMQHEMSRSTCFAMDRGST